MGQKWSEVALTNTVTGETLDPDVVLVPLLNTDEVDPADQNQFITIANLVANVIATLGVCSTFTATGLAGTTLQDNRLISTAQKPVTIASIRLLHIAGTEQVSLGSLASLNNGTGTIFFGAGIDFGGLTAIITLA